MKTDLAASVSFSSLLAPISPHLNVVLTVKDIADSVPVLSHYAAEVSGILAVVN